jgi:hypothetical protein
MFPLILNQTHKKSCVLIVSAPQKMVLNVKEFVLLTMTIRELLNLHKSRRSFQKQSEVKYLGQVQQLLLITRMF